MRKKRDQSGLKVFYMRPVRGLARRGPGLGSPSSPRSSPSFARGSRSRVRRPSLDRRHERIQEAVDSRLYSSLKNTLLRNSMERGPGGPGMDSPSVVRGFHAEFEDASLIAKGKFAEVLRVLSNDTGKYSIIKKELDDVHLPGLSLKHEVEVIRRLGVPSNNHVVLYEKAWEESGVMYIQMEDCVNGSLENYLETTFGNALCAPLEFVIKTLHDLGRGLEYAASVGVVHMDLKPENVFVDGNANLKLGDFGISYLMPSRWSDSDSDTDSDTDDDDDGQVVGGGGMCSSSSSSAGGGVRRKKRRLKKVSGRVGNSHRRKLSSTIEDGDPKYMAPELLEGNAETVGPWCDVFSLGILALGLLLGMDLPSRGSVWHVLRSGSLNPVLDVSEAHGVYMRDGEGRVVYEEVLRFLGRCIAPEYRSRPSAGEVVEFALAHSV